MNNLYDPETDGAVIYDPEAKTACLHWVSKQIKEHKRKIDIYKNDLSKEPTGDPFDAGRRREWEYDLKNEQQKLKNNFGIDY